MRFFGMLLILLMLPSAAYADKLIMVCENVTGKRVDFMHSSNTFEEGEDGYSNSKQIIIFDEDDPKKVSAKWQTAIPNGLDVSREFVDQIVKDEFKDEEVILIDGHRVSTLLITPREIDTAIYNFDKLTLLATRLVMTFGGGWDMAAYYKGRCERIN